jgi:small-conductance mechanosensitive channel
MRERRVVFKVGVVYQTTPEQLELIPKIIEEIIRAQPRTRFDRTHFYAYGDFSLDFEIVYYVLGADYSLYMDRQQEINLALYRRFQDEGIRFAYPTQEVFVRHLPPTSEQAAGASTT